MHKIGKTIRKRRKEGKTDYKQRLGLLKSGSMRIVVRKTNSYIIIQYVKSTEAKDKIIIGVSSKELLKNGWPNELKGSLKSIPAAYLTGLLIGKKITAKEKDSRAIADLGLEKSVSGSRVYAALKGIVDAGVKVNIGKNVFPDEERISGKHQSGDVQKIIKNVREKIQ
ncbi:MAG: 50S ribosomal protein L18 [Candidatus Pacearchaeota archaeon]